jgi:hypothetical protein
MFPCPLYCVSNESINHYHKCPLVLCTVYKQLNELFRLRCIGACLGVGGKPPATCGNADCFQHAVGMSECACRSTSRSFWQGVSESLYNHVTM